MFEIPTPKSIFFSKFGPKTSKLFGTHGISGMLDLILTLVFQIFNPKSIYGQFWAEKIKVVRFAIHLVCTQLLINWGNFFYLFST